METLENQLTKSNAFKEHDEAKLKILGIDFWWFKNNL
jgi:hypothetical protein